MQLNFDAKKRPIPFWVALFSTFFFPFFLYVKFGMTYVKEVLPPMKIIGIKQTIKIEDNAGLFDEEAKSKIMSSFENFRNKTGITPMLVVTYNEDWMNDYESLGDYGVEIYKRKINDGDHWLLMFSVSKDDPENGYYYWYTINGDSIHSLVTGYITNRFCEVFQDGMNGEDRSVPDALSKAMDTMSVEIFERGFGPEKRTVLPVKLDYEDHEIFIRDKTGLMPEEDIKKIRKAFTDFQNATGYTPALYVTTYDEWYGEYDNRSDFAEGTFRSLWKDGKHWMITYTNEPDDPENWHWNTYIGGTIRTMNYDMVYDVVSNTMLRNLKDEDDRFADALVKTMEAMTAEASKEETGTTTPMAKIVFAYGIFFAIDVGVWVLYFKRKHDLAKLKEDEEY